MGVNLRSTSKERGPGGGPTLGPMLKSLHRGLTGGGPRSAHDYIGSLMCITSLLGPIIIFLIEVLSGTYLMTLWIK